MSQTFEKKIYILLCNANGKRRMNFKSEQFEHVTVAAGELVRFICLSRLSNGHEPETTRVSEALILSPLNKASVEVCCMVAELGAVNRYQCELLLPISIHSERLEVYLHEAWLDEGMRLECGNMVNVKVTSLTTPFDMLGHVRYKGGIDGKDGVYFGIELDQPTGIGTTDGTLNGKKYFKCPPDCGVVVTLHDVRRHRPGETVPQVPVRPLTQSPISPRGHRSPQGATARASALPEFSLSVQRVRGAVAISVVGLEIGDRVIWCNDNGEEYGTVKWIGMLEGRTYLSMNDITVGVEFDNPVGTGTGRFHDERLFQADKYHASLVPLIGLVKADAIDNYGDPRRYTPPSEGTTFHLPPSEIAQMTEELPTSLRGADRGYRPPSEGSPGRHYHLPSTQLAQMTEELPTPVALNASICPEIKESGLEVGSVAEVSLSYPTTYGVVRWIGMFADQPDKIIAGLEMENEESAGTDGVFRRVRLFQCPHKKGLFVPLKRCAMDGRFVDTPQKLGQKNDFGNLYTPDISGNVLPPDHTVAMGDIVGLNKGIQGHHNSCYLDATLFSMFYFSLVFDSVFFRKKRPDDLPEYTIVQKTLKNGIVNPLRRNYYVRADKVMNFRQLLDELGSVSGMMSEEKDPEEFLNLFLSHIMKAEPFVKLTSGTECFYYQLFFEKDERLTQPTTQQLFELTFHQCNHKLTQVPACLIIQMPRHGINYRMYNRIIPSLELDITNVLDEAPRECTVCGELATIECKECYGQHSMSPSLALIAFCEGCNAVCHSHPMRVNHKPQPIKVSELFMRYYKSMKEKNDFEIPKEKLELTAVMCIATSHYVTFVKCGYGLEAPWIFFDSMADRQGGQAGYNIPQVSLVPEFGDWMTPESYKGIQETDDRQLHELLKRLVCDAYMCFYQNVDAAKYV